MAGQTEPVAGERPSGSLDSAETRRAAHAEARARELEGRLSAVLRLSQDLVLVTRVSDGVILEANDMLATAVGWTREELVGRTTAEIGLYVDPEDRRQMREEARGLRLVPHEIRVRTRAGQERTLCTNAALVDFDGERCISCVARDVTAQREADRTVAARERELCVALEQMRASEERYRSLVDHLDEVVFSVDAAGVITFINQAIARFGYRAEDVIGRRREDFTHPDDVARLLEVVGRDPAPGHVLEWRLIDAAGKPRFVRSTGRTIVTGGRVTGMTGVISDLTLQRDTEEQLRAAQKMEAVGRLAGGVAHDFNNLLSVIQSYGELVTEGLHEEDPLRADLTQILEASRRAAALTRQLLAFSRRQLFELEMLDLSELVAGLARMLRRVIGEDIELVIEAGPGLDEVQADSGQIEQVVMNLLVNARDAMPAGGRVTIATANAVLTPDRAAALELEPGAYVALTVTDTGCGMDDATRARIFEPFFTTKAVGKGTGLGLSTVYGIVKQSRGAIAVDSAPGRGATFRVYLPRHVREVSVALRPSISPPLLRGRENVLVVEDDAAVAEVVRRALASAGYRVTLTASADEAFAALDQRPDGYDLVLTDVVMPGGNGGGAVAERVRQRAPRARVLLMSGYADAIEQQVSLGVPFLRKPFDRRSLTDKVRAVLDGA